MVEKDRIAGLLGKNAILGEKGLFELIAGQSRTIGGLDMVLSSKASGDQAANAFAGAGDVGDISLGSEEPGKKKGRG